MRSTSLAAWRAHPLRRLAAIFVVLSLLAAACGDSGAQEGESGELRFVDVAGDAGLDFEHGAFRWGLSADPAAMMSGGVCWIDYDADGWLDLFLVNSWSEDEWGRWTEGEGLPTSALYRNRRGKFEDVSASSGAALPLRGNGCVAADLDGDGWTDLYVTSARESALLWNNGDGTFTEGAEAAGADVYGWHAGAAVGDVNADGRLDLFVTGYVDLNTRKEGADGGFPRSFAGRRDVLYLNTGPGPDGHATFAEVGEAAGIEPYADFEYGLGTALVDLDDDGDLDLYVANDTNPNRLYENVPWDGGATSDPEGLGFRLREIGETAAVADDNSGMGVAGGDFDGNGRFDLLVTNLDRQPNSVYANRGGLAFSDAGEATGIDSFGVGTTGWGVSWADFDLDADLDLLVANGDVPITDPAVDAQPVQLFESLTAQGSPGVFQGAAAAAGLVDLGPLMARGSATADYDNDGDLDVAINVVSGPVVLLENQTGAGNWLTVAPAPPLPGTVVTATLADGTVLRCQMHAGGSYLSSEDPRCHFGLGGLAEANVTVRWPDGSSERLDEAEAGRLVTVER